MAPELLLRLEWENDEHDSKADSFSFGCLLYRMLFGSAPLLRWGDMERVANKKMSNKEIKELF